MSAYMVPALVGLVLKLLILGLVVKRRLTDSLLVSLLLIFTIHDLIELLGYAVTHDQQAVAMLLRAYYIMTIIGLFSVSTLALRISKVKANWSRYVYAAWAVTLVLAIALGDSVIAGHSSSAYSLNAVEGSYFAFFTSFLAVVFCSAVVFLLIGMRRAASELQVSRCLYGLVALAPMVLNLFIVAAFHMFDLNLDTALLIPLATTFMVYLIYQGESAQPLTDIRRLLPFTLERRSAAKFMQLADSYTQKINNENAFNELRDGIERQTILYTIEKCDGNISETARMMGLHNRSTLYSMMKRLGIDPPSVAKAKQQG